MPCFTYLCLIPHPIFLTDIHPPSHATSSCNYFSDILDERSMLVVSFDIINFYRILYDKFYFSFV